MRRRKRQGWKATAALEEAGNEGLINREGKGKPGREENRGHPNIYM
jgi:hypothetical protein